MLSVNNGVNKFLGVKMKSYFLFFVMLSSLSFAAGSEEANFDDVDKFIKEKFGISSKETDPQEKMDIYRVNFRHLRGHQFGTTRFGWKQFVLTTLPRYTCQNNTLDQCGSEIQKLYVPRAGDDNWNDEASLVPLIKLSSFARNYYKKGIQAVFNTCPLRLVRDPDTKKAKVVVMRTHIDIKNEGTIAIPFDTYTEEYQNLIQTEVYFDANKTNLIVKARLHEKHLKGHPKKRVSSGLICKYIISEDSLIMTIERDRAVELSRWKSGTRILIQSQTIKNLYSPFVSIIAEDASLSF